MTVSAISGILCLSVIPHQEARFLLPAVPLILSSIHLPRSRPRSRLWLGAWILFNAILGILMGIYHQGGVVPVQAWISQNHQSLLQIPSSSTAHPGGQYQNSTQVLWWRTYPPPIWLLDHAPISTTNLMGIPLTALQDRIVTALDSTPPHSPTCDPAYSIAVVAPISSLDFETWVSECRSNQTETRSSHTSLIWEHKWQYNRHLNLDDLDFATHERGVWGELKRIVGKTGLSLWNVRKNCAAESKGGLVDDW